MEFGKHSAIIWWFAGYVLISSIDGSIINPSISLYLKSIDSSISDTIAGVAIGLFPIGLLVGIAIVCPLADLYFNPTMFVCMGLLVLSNLIYSTAVNVNWIMGTRFVAGFASASCMVVFGLGKRLVNDPTTADQVSALSRVSATLGAVIGPIFALAFTQIRWTFGSIVLNEYTLPGFVTAVLFFFIGVALLIIRPNLDDVLQKNRNTSAIDPQKKHTASTSLLNAGVSSDSISIDVDGGHKNNNNETQNESHYPSVAVRLTCILIGCVPQFTFMAFVAFNTQLTADNFHWGVQQNAIVFAIMGVAQIGVALIGVIWPKLNARYVSLCSLVMMLLGLMGMLHYGENGVVNLEIYFIGAAFIGCAYALLNNSGMVLFTHLFDSVTSKTMVPFLLCNVFMRGLGPIITGLAQSHTELNNAISISISFTVTVIVFTLVQWPNFKFKLEKQPEIKINQSTEK